MTRVRAGLGWSAVAGTRLEESSATVLLLPVCAAWRVESAGEDACFGGFWRRAIAMTRLVDAGRGGPMVGDRCVPHWPAQWKGGALA